MEKEKVIFIRNTFFRAFVIGMAFAVFFVILTLALWSTWMPWVTSLYRMEEKDVAAVVLGFFVNLRIVVVFFFLVPALALHWTAKKM